MNEFELLRLAQCPLRVASTDHSQRYDDAAASDAAAEEALRWTTSESSEGNVLSLLVVRARA